LLESGKKPLKKNGKEGGEKEKMNVNSLKNKKSLKLVALLTASLIIASVSAATYSELFMSGSGITVGNASVYFSSGGNTTLLSSAGISSAATEVTFDTIPDIEPGETITYEEAVNVTNGAGESKDITLDLYSITGDFDTNFDYVNITMIAADGSSQGNSIEIVSTGSNVTTTGSATMADADIWAIKWIIKAKTDATPSESFTITLKVTIS
jgi:hypothetical protein